jgi:hypothetical protein
MGNLLQNVNLEDRGDGRTGLGSILGYVERN